MGCGNLDTRLFLSKTVAVQCSSISEGRGEGWGMLCIPCFPDAFVDERLCCAHCKCGARTKQVPEGQRNVQVRLARLCHGIFSESLDTSLCVCALSVL